MFRLGCFFYLRALAREFRDIAKEVRPRIVFSGAEVLDATSRRWISSAFGGELFDLYGCGEFDLLAWECKAHKGYHINADNVLIEFLDDEGEAVASGEREKLFTQACLTMSCRLYDTS